MDDHRENTPEKGPVRPSDGLGGCTRGGALGMAWEALTQAHSAVDAMGDDVERARQLTFLGREWMALADRLGHAGAEKGSVRPVEGLAPGAWYAGEGRRLLDAQHTVFFGSDEDDEPTPVDHGTTSCG